MGDRNQMNFGMKHLNMFHPPFLEVGSLNCGCTASFRFLSQSGVYDYVGVDKTKGDHVDVMCDLTDSFRIVKKKLPGKFRTIFCLSVLEHCGHPFKMADNIEKLLVPGGVLYVSVPFSWEIHEFPADYWRFTPSGIKKIFPQVTFDHGRSAYHSTAENVFYAIDMDPPRVNRFLAMKKTPGFSAYGKWISLLRRLPIKKKLFHADYWYPPLQLNMIGTKK